MTRRERLQLVCIWFFLGVLPLFLRPPREPDEAHYAVLVELANPGHAWFFFIHGHFSRYTSHIHSRQISNYLVLDKLYFVGVLLAGLVPWLAATVVMAGAGELDFGRAHLMAGPDEVRSAKAIFRFFPATPSPPRSTK